MKKDLKKIMYSALALSAMLFSCNSQSPRPAARINTTITVDEFETRLSRGNAQLVDVRTPEEYSGGHLKNALNYNIGSADFSANLQLLDKNKPVLVYCLSGGRSAEAANMMSEEGFKEVYNLDGGLMKWNAAGKTLGEGANPEHLSGMTVEDFRAQVKTSHYVLVDFNAKWCKPCLKMLPMLEKLAGERKEKMKLVRIDADEHKALMQQKSITAIPYLELYKDGELVWKHEGEIDEKVLLSETKL